MTLCTECNKQYSEHNEGDLLRCNRNKDDRIKQLKRSLEYFQR